MYEVTKILEFCYGHRLRDYSGKCAHLHGHNGRVEVTLAQDALDPRGMVWDFGDIKQTLKPWVDTHLDHVTILRHDDPFVPIFQAHGEPLYLMEQNPTAETLARLIYDRGLEFSLPIASVRFWETPNSFAHYGRSRS